MTTATTTVATAAVEADAAEQREAAHIRGHHAHLVATLDRLAAEARAATGAGREPARRALVDFLDEHLVPHARAEERTIYAAAAELGAGRLLVDALVREHALVLTLVEKVRSSSDADAPVWGLALAEVFRSHQAKEDEVVVPLLLDTPGVSLVRAHRG